MHQHTSDYSEGSRQIHGGIATMSRRDRDRLQEAPKDFGKRQGILGTPLSTRTIVRLIVSRHVPPFPDCVLARVTEGFREMRESREKQAEA